MYWAPIYNSARDGLQQIWPDYVALAFGLALSAYTLMLWLRTDDIYEAAERKENNPLVLLLVSIVALLVGSGAAYISTNEYLSARDAIRGGNYQTVQGKIRDLEFRANWEKFNVQDVRFAFKSCLDPYYCDTKDSDGHLHEGTEVRIAYIRVPPANDIKIIRLDVLSAH